MGFLQGGVTYTRFAVRGPKPGLFAAEHLDRLRERAADRTGAPVPADGTAVGWTAGSHIWDNEFSEGKNVWADHLAWDFRMFTNKIPADQLKASYESRLASMARHNAGGLPTARQKREAKEEARGEMEAAAKDGRFKKWKTVPVLWDAVRNEVYFGGTSETAIGRFVLLFAETFSANLFEPDSHADKLLPRTAAALACSFHPAAKDAVFSKFLPDGPEEVRWSLFEGTPAFLGNEFLLWLWSESDTRDTVKVRDGSDITYMFSGGVRLEHPTEKDNDTINAGSAVRKPQALRAIQSGHLPRKAVLTLVRHGDQFQFKLDAETMQVSGAKLPKPDDAVVGLRARTEDRLTHLRGLVEALDLLYATFVERRLSSLWAHDLADMRAWLGAPVRSGPAPKRKGR